MTGFVVIDNLLHVRGVCEQTLPTNLEIHEQLRRNIPRAPIRKTSRQSLESDADESFNDQMMTRFRNYLLSFSPWALFQALHSQVRAPEALLYAE